MPRFETVLPTAETHVVLSLPVPTVWKPGASLRRASSGHFITVVVGPRATPYSKLVPPERRIAVGFTLRPEGHLPMLGLPAGELAEGRFNLADLWPAGEAKLADGILGAASLRECLTSVRRVLAAERLRPRGHAAIAQSLKGWSPRTRVDDMVRWSGLSHRAFSAGFREHLGLGPKRFARLQRFSGVVDRLASSPCLGQAELAVRAGYFDQSHMIRDFREFAHVTPVDYVRRAPVRPFHLLEDV